MAIDFSIVVLITLYINFYLTKHQIIAIFVWNPIAKTNNPIADTTELAIAHLDDLNRYLHKDPYINSN